MSQSSCVRSEREAFAASQGASINANNGIYVNGQSYGLAKKLEVAAVLKGEERRVNTHNHLVLMQLLRSVNVVGHLWKRFDLSCFIMAGLSHRQRLLRIGMVLEELDRNLWMSSTDLSYCSCTWKSLVDLSAIMFIGCMNTLERLSVVAQSPDSSLLHLSIERGLSSAIFIHRTNSDLRIMQKHTNIFTCFHTLHLNVSSSVMRRV